MKNYKRFNEFVNEKIGHLGGIKERFREDRTDTATDLKELVKDWNEKVKDMTYDEIDKTMQQANDLLGGYGVEPLTDEDAWVSKYYQNIIAVYVNMGDTYDTTIVFDTENQEFLATSWGDFYEDWQEKNNSMKGEIPKGYFDNKNFKSFDEFVNERKINEGEFYADELEEDGDWGVFYTDDDEFGKSGHCYASGTKEQCEEIAKEKNAGISNRNMKKVGRK